MNSDDHSSLHNVDQLWDEIGFHKPLAGFWYKLVLMLLSLVLSIVISGLFLGFFYPYPESASYRSIAGGIFVLYFQLFDLGTHMTMDRFIAESRIKDPKKMLLYIQYFILYQMITGLIQTTTVSIYALYYVPRTDLAYAVWIMLVVSTTQYPGFLSVFNGVLSSLQHYNKSEILNFVSGEVFQRITEIGFLLLGKWYGANHPEIGELMGIAIGSAIGLYVDDFFATILAAYYFAQVMHSEKIRVRDCFRHDFTWEFIKEPLIFGIKTGLPWIEYTFSNLIILWIWLTYVPQYATFAALSGMAGGIAGFINIGMSVIATPVIAESYMNGKTKLTQYYLGQMWRFAAFVQGFLLSILLIVSLVLKEIFIAMNLTNYLLAVPFIIPWIIRHLQQPYTSLGDSIILGSNHPNIFLAVCILQDVIRLIFVPLWVIWLALPAKYGIDAIIWILPCGEYIPILMKTAAMYIFTHKKLFPLKIPLWQSFGASWIATGMVFMIEYIVKITIFDTFVIRYNIFVASGVCLFIFIGLMLFLYGPLTALLGGWDDLNLREFEKAAKMSGPSKFIVWPLYRIISWSCKNSRFHNRFQIDSETAIKEAAELLELKNSHRIKDV